MFPILLKIGPFTLHTYGLMVALGFIAGVKASRVQFERRGLPASMLDRLVFWLMVFGLLGARIFYFAVDNFSALKDDPLSFFRIWEGGLVFYGGVIGGLVTLVIFARRNKLPFLALTDAFAVPLLLSHAIGRLGCFAAGCCYGKPSNLPWAVIFKDENALAPLYVSLHPTQLYEAAGDLLLFFLGLRLADRQPRRGVLTAYYCVAYGAFRFVLEFFRGDDRGYIHFGLEPSQIVALTMCAGGIYLWQKAKKT